MGEGGVQMFAFGESKSMSGFPGGSVGKESACNAADLGLIPGSGRSAGKEMAAHFRILSWEIPWTEEPGRLQSMGLQESDMTWLNHQPTNQPPNFRHLLTSK